MAGGDNLKPVAGGPPPEMTGWFVYDRIIAFDELGLMIPYSRMHIGRLEKADKFPKRIPLGDGGRVGWSLHEVLEWIASKKAARDAKRPAKS